MEERENKVDPWRAYEAIARIISAREHVDIKLVGLKKKEESTKDDTA